MDCAIRYVGQCDGSIPYGGMMYGDHGDDDPFDGTDGSNEDLGDHGSALSGCLDEDVSQSEKDWAERSKEAQSLLDPADEFKERPDAEQIRDNFRRYVRDAKSDDPGLRQAAIEGACRDLEFFMMYLIAKK